MMPLSYCRCLNSFANWCLSMWTSSCNYPFPNADNERTFPLKLYRFELCCEKGPVIGSFVSYAKGVLYELFKQNKFDSGTSADGRYIGDAHDKSGPTVVPKRPNG